MYKEILFATDFTDECQEIVGKKAKALAEHHNARLSLVHAIGILPVTTYGYYAVERLQDEIDQEARKRMKEVAKQVGVSEDNCYMEHESSKTTILDVAKQTKADLIVVGSHGQHGFLGLLGSTAAAVVNHAECDVYVVRFPYGKDRSRT